MTREEFRALQLAARMTNQAIADRLGVSIGTVEAWRRGRRSITKHMAELIRMKIKP